jgi:hypothetical protein
MEKKMTRKQMFEQIMSKYALDEVDKAFIEKEISKIDNKATNKKPTATQVENEKIKEDILKVMTANGEKMTVGQMEGAFDKAYTNQKLSALMNAMVKDGVLIKTSDKKVSYFEVA